jgi:arsenite oxidase small subunit
MDSGPGADCAGAAERRRLILGLLSLPFFALRPATADAASAEPVATLADLAEPWSAVKFTLPGAGGEALPCIVVRLPGGEFYASSLICPHNKCEIAYVSDPETARSNFDVDVATPVLACPCHFSVFDLLRHGEVIAGPAPSPPAQLKVEIRDKAVFVSQ